MPICLYYYRNKLENKRIPDCEEDFNNICRNFYKNSKKKFEEKFKSYRFLNNTYTMIIILIKIFMFQIIYGISLYRLKKMKKHDMIFDHYYT